VHRTRLEPAARHGLEILAEIARLSPSDLAPFAPHDVLADDADLVFLDVETTGLGNDDLVFLVGLGGIDRSAGGAFVVEQHLLRDEAGEHELLAAVMAKLSPRTVLVSYVGKSFDRHRLDARFARLRGTRPLRELPHVDLHPATRRLFAHRMRDARLATVEAKLLGVERGADLSGAHCPEAWLDFTATGERRFIEPVLRHNLLDVFSLGALLLRARRALVAPEDVREAACAGVMLAERGRPASGRPLLERAVATLRAGSLPPPADIARAATTLAALHAADGRAAEGIEVLLRLGTVAARDPEPFLAASRLAERGAADPVLAARLAREALRRIEAQRGAAGYTAPELSRIARRIARLDARAAAGDQERRSDARRSFGGG
jgi:uncharacterized protein YprB with RNaseH-like and TPR domain